MLQNIREGARGWLAWVIVAVISIPFAFWGINEYFSPAPTRVIAEVNDVELSEYDFRRQVNQQKQRLRAMFQNPNLDLSFMDEQIKQSTLKRMIEEELLVQSAVDVGMRISDALLVGRIHSIPAFQEDGTFSQERYEQLLGYQGLTPPGFERDIRRELLTEQIREGVLRSALITDYDQQQRTRLEEQQRSISYLIIPTSRFKDSVTFTDTDIEAYYKDHADQYMTPEQVSIEYVQLSVEDLINKDPISEETLTERYQERKASFTKPAQWKARHILIDVDPEAVAELEQAEQKAQDLLAKIRAGEAFDALASEFSDDFGSKKTGGDLGWFGPGRMVKPFEEAVKAMKVGEISEPVKSQFGLHIIKLEDTKPKTIRPLAEVREQLEKDVQKERAESAFEDQVEQMANLAFERPDSLEGLTGELNLKSQSTELFEKHGNQPQDSILSHRQVIDAAFSDEVLTDRVNSDVIDIGEQQVVVLRVKDHVPAKAKPIAEVKEQIESSLTQEKTSAEAKTLGESLLEQIKLRSDPEAVVKEHDLKWSAAHWVKRKDTTPKPTIVREAFKMGHPTENQGLYQSLALDNGDYALVAVLAIKDGVAPQETTASATAPEDEDDKDNTQSDAQRQQVKQQQAALGETEFNQLVSGLKANAEIRDYSKQLLEDS